MATAKSDELFSTFNLHLNGKGKIKAQQHMKTLLFFTNKMKKFESEVLSSLENNHH